MQPISIQQLAKLMLLRKESGENPYLLFLGAGVSISSGVSNMSDLIDRFLIDFGLVSDDKLPEMDRDKRFQQFISEMENLSQSERYAWLKEGFKDLKPSLGFIALTKLIEDGYFDVIFTTAWDRLLNLSLNSSHVIKNKNNFRFYVRGVNQDDFIIREFRRPSTQRIKILKLHGEIDSGVIFVTPKETANFPNNIANLLKDFFKTRDLIMIGYSVSDMDVQRCIDQNENTLIYINPKPLNNQLLLSLASNYKYPKQIVGRDGEFDVFMNKLYEAIFNKKVKLESLGKGTTKMPQVFISYARQDADAARKINEDLKRRGVDTWFDEESLLPGQNWRTAIKKAIKDSRFFLALLSSNSVTKKGFVNKELREALELLDEFPESAIFIIPVRLNNCTPSHEKLLDLNWVDLFISWQDGIEKILRSIQTP